MTVIELPLWLAGVACGWGRRRVSFAAARRESCRCARGQWSAGVPGRAPRRVGRRGGRWRQAVIRSAARFPTTCSSAGSSAESGGDVYRRREEDAGKATACRETTHSMKTPFPSHGERMGGGAFGPDILAWGHPTCRPSRPLLGQWQLRRSSPLQSRGGGSFALRFPEIRKAYVRPLTAVPASTLSKPRRIAGSRAAYPFTSAVRTVRMIGSSQKRPRARGAGPGRDGACFQALVIAVLKRKSLPDRVRGDIGIVRVTRARRPLLVIRRA